MPGRAYAQARGAISRNGPARSRPGARAHVTRHQRPCCRDGHPHRWRGSRASSYLQHDQVDEKRGGERSGQPGSPPTLTHPGAQPGSAARPTLPLLCHTRCTNTCTAGSLNKPDSWVWHAPKQRAAMAPCLGTCSFAFNPTTYPPPGARLVLCESPECSWACAPLSDLLLQLCWRSCSEGLLM